jgi:uncharacterized protein
MNVAIKAATTAATKAALSQAREINDAQKFVRPWVGDIAIACDSATDVFGAALKALGVKNVEKIHPSAYRTILENMPQPNARSERQLPHVAMDAAVADDYDKMFPDAGRIGLM